MTSALRLPLERMRPLARSGSKPASAVIRVGKGVLLNAAKGEGGPWGWHDASLLAVGTDGAILGCREGL